MHGCAHGTAIPPYDLNPPPENVWTAGFVMSIPSPAGTMMCLPLTNTSRCECTWYCSCSASSGTSPAFRASAIGSLGAGYGAGSDTAGAEAVITVVLPDFDDEPHAASAI